MCCNLYLHGKPINNGEILNKSCEEKYIEFSIPKIQELREKKSVCKKTLSFLCKFTNLFLGLTTKSNGEKLRDQYKSKTINFRNF
jgi:hypothetical protein